MKLLKEKKDKGLTLIETLIATLITVVAIVAILSAYQYNFFLSKTSRGISTALSDIRDVIERIACTPFNNITTDFPDGVANGGGANDYSAIAGGYSLADEQIIVGYSDPSADPLEIIITVNWSGPNNRAQAVSLSTFKTE